MTRTTLLAAIAWAVCGPAFADDPPLRDDAAKALKTAVTAFRERVSTEGGALWKYGDDLARREGETRATASEVWVQPPGTPSVGLALVEAFEATGEPACREAARDAALALVRGQLRSGGWDYRIEFDPEKRRAIAYRVPPAAPEGRGRNVSTLDDDTTQAAIRCLVRVDQMLEFADPAIHEAAQLALKSLRGAQTPAGGWPQRFEQPADPSAHPEARASFAPDAPRSWPELDYRGYVTLNDNLLPDAVETLLLAGRVYDEPGCREAALRVGEFLIRAQLPEPQPAWAQQYDAAMHPAWARKFEPPAITGGESQGALRLLLRLYRETGDARFLEPVPRALDYLARSRLADGRLARFYEPGTNRPLYFTKTYMLTYDDTDVPTHYSFKSADGTPAIAREYERLRASGGKAESSPRPAPPPSEADVRAVIAGLDGRGLWVEEGRLRSQGPDDPTRRVIATSTYIRNVGILSRFLSATRP